MAVLKRKVASTQTSSSATYGPGGNPDPREHEAILLPLRLGWRLYERKGSRLHQELQRLHLCTEESPFDKALVAARIHKLIPPRTLWHNGKVERSHRNDQRYFYDWEKFSDVEELNRKLKAHLAWSNRKTMRTLGGKSPLELLREKLAAA